MADVDILPVTVRPFQYVNLSVYNLMTANQMYTVHAFAEIK